MTKQSHKKTNNAKQNHTKPDGEKLSDHLGIDVSKRQLDYSFGKALHRESVPNAPEGFARIIKVCRLRPGARVVCEATGGYEKKLVKALRKEAIEVHVVMPLKVKCLAMAMGLMAKTDKIDAEKLSVFSEKIELKASHVASEHDEKLRELVECRTHLVERLVQLAGKRENAGERLLKLINKEEAQLQKHKKQIEKEIEACIAEDKNCQDKLERMCQVKGVGRTVAACVLAHMPELGAIPDKTASALAGLAPYPDESGSVKKPGRIRGGRYVVRKMLYLSALCAMKYNPVLRQFNQRLEARGKAGKTRVVAVARKLICLLNRICADPEFTPQT
jgi:transposase